MDVTLNDNTLSRLRLRVPRRGAWTYECLHADPGAVPEVGDTATLTMGSQVFVGTVVRVSVLQDLGWDTLVVGGAGKLGTELPPDQLISPTLGVVLSQGCTGVGETLGGISSEISSLSLPSWRRPGRTLGRELDAAVEVARYLLGREELVWRVTPAGAVWLGEDTWGAPSLEYLAMAGDAGEGCHTIASEDPTVLPGQSWVTGERIGEVVHLVEPGATRTEIWVSGGEDRDAWGLDALLPPLGQFAPRIYRLVLQNTDGSLELRSTDTRYPDLSKVPYRPGIPGASADLVAGQEVVVVFGGGDERDPYACSWLPGTPTNLRIPVGTLLELGASPAASFVALATLTDARVTALQQKLDSLISSYNTHIHPGVTVGAGSTTPTTSTQSTLGGQATVAATRVKAT